MTWIERFIQNNDFYLSNRIHKSSWRKIIKSSRQRAIQRNHSVSQQVIKSLINDCTWVKRKKKPRRESGAMAQSSNLAVEAAATLTSTCTSTARWLTRARKRPTSFAASRQRRRPPPNSLSSYKISFSLFHFSRVRRIMMKKEENNGLKNQMDRYVSVYLRLFDDTSCVTFYFSGHVRVISRSSASSSWTVRMTLRLCGLQKSLKIISVIE